MLMQNLSLFLLVALGTLHYSSADFISKYKDKTNHFACSISEDLIKAPDYQCTKVTIAETEVAKSNLVQKLEKSNAYVLIYKKDGQWLLEKDIEKSMKIIKSNLGRKISYGQGNISIGGVAFPEVKYVVAIN